MKLVIETEHLHTGKLNITKETVLGVWGEDRKKEYKDSWRKKLEGMHMRTNYRLSRIYWED